MSAECTCIDDVASSRAEALTARLDTTVHSHCHREGDGTCVFDCTARPL
jgi:hypothetical protein